MGASVAPVGRPELLLRLLARSSGRLPGSTILAVGVVGSGMCRSPQIAPPAGPRPSGGVGWGRRRPGGRRRRHRHRSNKHRESASGGSKRIAAYLGCSLLYHLRHPDFLRKSSSGGLPYGALGRELISIRERGRVEDVVTVAESGATHSQGLLSLLAWALSEASPTRGSGEAPAARPGRRRGGRPGWAGSQRSAQYCLSLLTQARIPS